MNIYAQLQLALSLLLLPNLAWASGLSPQQKAQFKQEKNELDLKYKLQEKANKKQAKKAGIPEGALSPYLKKIEEQMQDLIKRIQQAKLAEGNSAASPVSSK